MSGILLIGFLVLEGSLAQVSGEWSYQGWSHFNLDSTLVIDSSGSWSSWSSSLDWGDFEWDENIEWPTVDWSSLTPDGLSSSWADDWADDWVDGWSSSGTFDMVDVNQHWTDDASLNWCRDSWVPDRVTDSNWDWMVEEFINSGDISVWCTFTGAVFLISDLRNANLNKKEDLPSMFGYSSQPCTREMCFRHLADQRQGMRIEDMVKRVWGYLDIFKQLDCPDCFCGDPLIREELERVSSVAKDYLKVFKILNHNTVAETPIEVKEYFDELKKMYLLDVAPQQDPTYARPLITLMDMETAMAGPGAAAMEITLLREMEHGIAEFCDPERQIEPRT